MIREWIYYDKCNFLNCNALVMFICIIIVTVIIVGANDVNKDEDGYDVIDACNDNDANNNLH